MSYRARAATLVEPKDQRTATTSRIAWSPSRP